MNLVNGATYRFLSRNAEGDTGTNGKGRSLNVYGTQPTSLANVCLYLLGNGCILLPHPQ